MAADITVAISGIDINDNRAVCSTLPTGQTSKLLIRPNYPVNLTIVNIENKFDNRFDDPRYYSGDSAS
jgi:hypothetical protein